MANFTRYPTGLSIVQDVCGRLGLAEPAAAASSPSDETARQLWRLLTECGRKLMKRRRWQIMARTWNLATVIGVTEYDLPEDFDGFTDQTAWNTSSRLPLIGPALDSQWSMLTARNLGASTISIVYRTRDGKLQLYNTPTQVDNLIIDYASRAWVMKNGDPAVLRDHMLLDDDQCLLDGELVTSFLKLRFLEEKGFDTTAAKRDFDEAFDDAADRDTDAPVLRLDRLQGYPYLSSDYNLPDTNYGL